MTNEPTQDATPRQNRRMNEDLIFGLLLLVLVAVIFYASRGYPQVSWQQGGSVAMWPRALAVVLAVLAVSIMFAGYHNPTRVTWPAGASLRFLLLAAAIMFVSRWTLEWLGYPISGALLIFFGSLALTGRSAWNPRTLVWYFLISWGVSLLMYFVLSDVARFPLPQGNWFR